MIYEKCVSYPKIDPNVRSCDGPNFASKTLEEIVDWLNARLKYLGWTHKLLAEKANSPLGTVDPILAKRSKNPTLETLRPLLWAVGCGGGEDRPCPDSEAIAAMEEELERLRSRQAAAGVDSEKKIEYLKSDIAARNRRIEKQDALLEERMNLIKIRDKFIILLCVVLFLLLVVIIAALIMDRLNPELGFIWRTAFSLPGQNFSPNGI